MPIRPASPSVFADSLLSSVYQNETTMQQLEQELATGQSILSPSDNPAGAVQTLHAQAAQTRVAGYVTSTADGLERLGLANSTMTSVLGQISQVQQSVLSTSTATLASQGLASLATRIQGIATSLLTEANTSYKGYALFGGTSGATQAFDSSGNYLGNGTAPSRTVGEGTTLPAGLTGDKIFGNGSSGLFGVLATTVSDLKAGNVSAVLGKDLSAINGLYATAQEQTAVLGSYYDQMQAAQGVAQQMGQTLARQVSDVSSVNLPQAITELNLRQTSLQAALWATAKVIPQSLISYLP